MLPAEPEQLAPREAIREMPGATVDLSSLIRVAEKGGSNVGVYWVAKALTMVKINGHNMDTQWGSKLTDSYREWQRRLGLRGHDADGVPGFQSLTALGAKSGLFKVVL